MAQHPEAPPSYTAVAGDGVDALGLVDIVEDLKRQLNISPKLSIIATVDQACDVLHISDGGNGLLARAHACYTKLYGSQAAGGAPLVRETVRDDVPQAIPTHNPDSGPVIISSQPKAQPACTDTSVPGYLSTQDISGPWCCICGPFFAFFSKRAVDEDTLVHDGLCFPMLLPFRETWKRVAGSNNFKGDGVSEDQYCAHWCVVNGISCSVKNPCFGRATRRVIPAKELEGCSTCFCPPLCWSAFRKTAIDNDRLQHKGCCFLGPLPLCYFNQLRTRKPGTNKFVKDGCDQDVDEYSSPGRAFNGASCTCRWCC